MIKDNVNKTMIKKNLTFESSFLSILILFTISKLLDIYGLLNLFYLFLIIELLNILFKSKYKSQFFKQLFLKLRMTAFISYFSSAIIGFKYSTFIYDWLLIGVGANKKKFPELYINDYQAAIAHPHIGIHSLINSINDLYYFSEIMFLFFLIQTHLFCIVFLTIFKNLKLKNFNNNKKYFILSSSFLAIPYTSGLHATLPWFLPHIFGFALSSMALIIFLYSKKRRLVFFVLFLLIFIHSYWSALTPLVLLTLQFMKKKLYTLESFLLLCFLLGPLFLLPPGDISITSFFALVRSDFHFITQNPHFFWFSRPITNVKAFFGFSGLYQGFSNLILLIIYCFNIKNIKIFSKSSEVNILSILTIGSLISLTSVFFQNTLFHDILITTNFFRINLFNWIFLPLLLSKILNNKNFNFLIYLIFLGLYFVSYSLNGYIGLISIAMLILIFLDAPIKQNFYNLKLLFVIFNLLLYFTIEQYIAFFNILFFTCLIIKRNLFIKKVDFQPLVLTALICTSYLGFTQFNNVNIAVNSCFDKDSTELIQEYVLVEELVLTNPNLDCFRRDTKRSQVFSFGFLPYNVEQGEWYLYQDGVMKNWEDYSHNTLIELAIENKSSHILIKESHRASNELKKIYDFVIIQKSISATRVDLYYLFRLN